MILEATYGWYWAADLLRDLGYVVHLANPKGNDWGHRRVKNDRPLRRLALRELLQAGELPLSWIPPDAVLEWRERVRLVQVLVDQRTLWCQRIHAELYHHGVAVPEGAIRSEKTRALPFSNEVQLSPAGRAPDPPPATR